MQLPANNAFLSLLVAERRIRSDLGIGEYRDSCCISTNADLVQRADTLNNVTENFCYDALNRLTNYGINGTSCTTCPYRKPIRSAF